MTKTIEEQKTNISISKREEQVIIVASLSMQAPLVAYNSPSWREA
jgi:hypothetical protein